METRRLLVVARQEGHRLLVKLALLRLESWVEVRWVRDAIEAREALEEGGRVDLVLLTAPGAEIERALTTLGGPSGAARVAVLERRSLDGRRARLLARGVALLGLPPSAAELQAILEDGPAFLRPGSEHPIEV